MRFSKSYIKTLKETPKEAETASHKLLLRASMIKKTYKWSLYILTTRV